MRTEHGLTMLSTTTFADSLDFGLVCVPGGFGVNALLDDEVLAYLRNAAMLASYVTSVCTGALVLGAAGCSAANGATKHIAGALASFRRRTRSRPGGRE